MDGIMAFASVVSEPAHTRASALAVFEALTLAVMSSTSCCPLEYFSLFFGHT